MPTTEAQEAVSEFESWLEVWTKAEERARTDPAFRAALLQDARAALSKYFNYTLDPGIDLSIVEAGQQEAAKLTIRLPGQNTKQPWISTIGC